MPHLRKVRKFCGFTICVRPVAYPAMVRGWSREYILLIVFIYFISFILYLYLYLVQSCMKCMCTAQCKRVHCSACTEIRFMYSQKWNCVASFKIPTFIYHRYMNVEIGRQCIYFCYRNNKAAQFNFWEYINQNQTFILDSHRPFICSVYLKLEGELSVGPGRLHLLVVARLLNLHAYKKT